ncbi:MAG TPA: transglutaminase domain-containing protein [Chitinophagaceae bacterium]|nr:transglutaminase domain-containing protein [Chitinophagaceae bacterium]
MIKTAVILLLLFAQNVFAQQRQVSFSEIDNRVKSIDPSTPAELAYTLTKDYSTDREKLRSIFSWIAEHISYRVKQNKITVNNYTGRQVFTDTAKWKSANDMMAEIVLQNKSAVCDGYARLFKSLCDYAGLRSAIITGFAKGDLSRQLKFRCNHTWNAVYIDSAWRLLDITWASGYTSYSGDEFIKRYDETYFLAAPEDFIRDHFPDDLRWTLMEKPPSPREFNNGPYKNKSFGKYKINDYSPGAGIIEASVGDTIQIVLETGDPVADSRVAADTIAAFDSVLQKIVSFIAFAEPSKTNKNKQQLRYTFFVENDTIEWLHIIYNHDTVLRYRLRIKKVKTGLAANTRKEQAYALPNQ